MYNLNYPFRVSKNKPPSVFRKDKMMEQKINKENIENILVFSIDPRKSIPDLFFEIRHIRTK